MIQYLMQNDKNLSLQDDQTIGYKTMSYDFQAIEKKWKKEWAENPLGYHDQLVMVKNIIVLICFRIHPDQGFM